MEKEKTELRDLSGFFIIFSYKERLRPLGYYGFNVWARCVNQNQVILYFLFLNSALISAQQMTLLGFSKNLVP